MAGWSQLPPEIKLHVCKYLDFMSRYAMKCVAHTERYLVNSTKFSLPRVRFGFKEERILIVIYEGIETFMRLEIIKARGKIHVYRSENLFDLAQFDTKTVDFAGDVLAFGIQLLRDLFAHKSTKIDCFEWDIQKKSDQADIHITNRILAIMGDQKIRAKQVATIWNTDYSLSRRNFNESFFVYDEVESVRKFSVNPSDKSLVPQMIFDSTTDSNGKKHYTSCICLDLHNSEYISHLDVGINSMMANQLGSPEADNDTTFCWRELRAVPKKFVKFRRTRVDNQPIVDRAYTSRCGQWYWKMYETDEERFKVEMDATVCGLDWMCRKHGDPFEYWYYHNVPRRAYDEHFWNDVYTRHPDDDDGAALKYVQMLCIAEEKRNGRRLQQQQKKTLKPSSWGFKWTPPPPPAVDQNARIQAKKKNPPNQKNHRRNRKSKKNRKMKKVWRKEILQKASEECVVGEEDSEFMKNLKIALRTLKYLVFPIFLSFLISVFFYLISAVYSIYF